MAEGQVGGFRINDKVQAFGLLALVCSSLGCVQANSGHKGRGASREDYGMTICRSLAGRPVFASLLRRSRHMSSSQIYRPASISFLARLRLFWYSESSRNPLPFDGGGGAGFGRSCRERAAGASGIATARLICLKGYPPAASGSWQLEGRAAHPLRQAPRAATAPARWGNVLCRHC